MTSEAVETVVSVTAKEAAPRPVYMTQYSTAMNRTLGNGPTVLVMLVYLVGEVLPITFELALVLLSQFLNRKVQVPRLLVWQFQTVIQRLAKGAPWSELAAKVRSKVQVPDWIVAPPRSVL